MSDVLSFTNVGISFDSGANSNRVIRDVSLSVAIGEAVALVGESGSGKTTLAYAAMRHLPRGAAIDQGSVSLFGEDLAAMRAEALRNLRGNRVAMVHQDPMSSLNPLMPIGAQMVEPAVLHLGMTRDEARGRAIRLLDEVEIDQPGQVLTRYPHQISGGQQQRVMIAMALMCDPDLVILDEPTTGLDVMVEASVLNLLGRLHRTRGMAMLVISHNLGIVARLCSRVGILHRGALVEVGPVERVLTRPEHPYTRALLECLPKLGPDSRKVRLPTLAERSTGPVGRAAPPPVQAAGNIVEARGISVRYGARGRAGEVVALDNVDLDLPRGGTIAVVGQSGSGKSTVARVISGLMKPQAGSLTIDGGEVAGLWVDERPEQARRQVQLVFQNPESSLNPSHSVGYALGRALRRLGGVPRGDLAREVERLLAMVELPAEFAQRYPAQLSGGQKQRVAIARALAGRPELLVADEAVSALDVSVQAAILNLLNDLQRLTGMTLVFISHDLAAVSHVADRIVVMRHGVIVESGPSADVLTKPADPYTKALLDAARELSLTTQFPRD
jgi:ATPase components of various ABC-type transport systems, contain duplicated ATPase